MISDLTRLEMQAIAWERLGIRAAPSTTKEQYLALFSFEIPKEDLPPNPVNNMRDELIAFIAAHRDQLSLPCEGDCYQHSDGVVLACYLQYKEDQKHAENDKEDASSSG